MFSLAGCEYRYTTVKRTARQCLMSIKNSSHAFLGSHLHHATLPYRQELMELSHMQPRTSASKTNNHVQRLRVSLSLPPPLSTSLPPFHSAGADGGGPVSITVRPEPHRRTAPPRRANYAISPGPTPSDHRTSVTSAGGLPQASPDSSLSHIPTSSSAIFSPRLRLNAVSASLQTAVPISPNGRLHLPTFSDESPHLFPRGPL